MTSPFIRRYDRLLACARGVAAELRQDPRIQAILLTGSVAQDRVDAFSDIDLILYLTELPDLTEYQALVADAEASGGRLYGGAPPEGFALFKFIDGVKVDLAYTPLAEAEQDLTAFLADPTVDDPNKLVIARGIRDGLALHGPEIIQDWQARLADCPPLLSERLVAANLRGYGRWVLTHMGADRGDLLFLHEALVDASRRLLMMLYGINRRWPTGKVKGLRHAAPELAIAPPDFAGRVEAMLTANPHQAVAELLALLEDTYDLVDRHMPEVSTAAARAALAWEPPQAQLVAAR